MSDTESSAKEGTADSPEINGDLEMKSVQSDSLSESRSASPRSSKRKTPSPSIDGDQAMKEGGDDLFGSDDDNEGGSDA